MTIKIIAACDLNYGIGFENQLLFRIKEDLQRFRQLTENQLVIMGRKTFESLPAPLPNRKNIVLTRDKSYQVPKGVHVQHSFEQVINHYLQTGKQDRDLWVIGGSEIYRSFIPFGEQIHLTMILKKAEKVDTFFPYHELDKFVVVSEERHYSEKDDCEYLFVTYERCKGDGGSE